MWLQPFARSARSWKTSASLFSEDPLYALALDGLGNAAVENLAQQVCGEIAEQVESTKACKPPLRFPRAARNGRWRWDSHRFSQLLDPSKAGISLTHGGMMIPKKSVSFVVGIGPEMSQASMCSVCSLKETCRYQNA